LDGAHAHARGPIHEFAQVAEVADAERRLTAQGEHGNHDAGAAPHREVEAGRRGKHEGRRVLHGCRAGGQRAVLAAFPKHVAGGVFVDKNDFVFQFRIEIAGFQRAGPLVSVRALQCDGLFGLPFAQRLRIAEHAPAEAFRRGQGRHEQQVLVVAKAFAERAAVLAKHALREGGVAEHRRDSLFGP